MKEVKNIGDINDIEDNNKLTSGQQILYEFAEDKLNQGWDINEIEKFMQDRKERGEYSDEDIFKAINCIIRNRVVTLEGRQNEKVYKQRNSALFKGKSDAEQERFLAFLQENPSHELSTVQLYNQVGLSVRKGNNIKNKLLEQNKIKIQEIKYNKGWKKIIKLA